MGFSGSQLLSVAQHPRVDIRPPFLLPPSPMIGIQDLQHPAFGRGTWVPPTSPEPCLFSSTGLPVDSYSQHLGPGALLED